MDRYEKHLETVNFINNQNKTDPIHPDEPETPTLPERHTPNYKLPLWDKNSVTSWMSTMNYAMTTIDFALHKLALGTPLDGDIPDSLVNSITALEEWKQEAEERISTVELNLIALQKTVNTIQESLNQLTIKVDTNTRDIEELRGGEPTYEEV